MKDIIRQISTNKFIKNTGWLIFVRVYQMILSLIIGVISARYLGPSNYGTINYAASYISFFSIICELGLESIVISEMVFDRKKEGIILGSSIIMRILAGIISMFSVCVLVFLVNPNDKVLLKVAFLQSVALVFNAFHIIDTWYQSMLRSKTVTIVKCITYTCVSIYKLILLIFGKSVEWFAVSMSLDSFLIALLLLILYKRDGYQKLKGKMQYGKKLVGQSYHLIISNAIAVIYSQMDRVMIGKIIGQVEVGYYVAAATICNMWLFIPKAFADSARPLIMEQKDKNEIVYIKRLSQLICFTFWLGVIFAIGITIFSEFIVGVLYGKEYMLACKVLVIIVWSTVFSSISYSKSIWIISERKQKTLKYVIFWGVIINLLLNYFWIPNIGINGAAYATVITEIVCLFIAPAVYKETRPFVILLIKSIFPIEYFKKVLKRLI